MTQNEVGAYILLLCHQWNCGSVSCEKSRLILVAKGEVTEHVLSKFPNGKNKRLEEERKKQRIYREKQAINGSKGGRPAKPKPNPSLSFGLSQTKAKKSSPSPSPSPSSFKTPPPAIAGEHQAFFQGWTEGFKKQFGFDYVVDGGRDGKAVKELLRTGILRIDLLEIAKKAWSNQKAFSCRQSSTIHGFHSYFNQIRAELNGYSKQHFVPKEGVF